MSSVARSFSRIYGGDLDTLVERSGVLFIYASTVVRYIGHDNFSRAGSRLKQILALTKDSSSDSEKDINALYSAILAAAFDDSKLTSQDLREMRLVLHTAVSSLEPLSVDVMAGLLGLDAESVWAALRPLFSVLYVLDTTQIVTTLHESFPDYLLNRDRSGVFHCDVRKHNTQLARLCFEQMKLPDPPFNICNLESSYVPDRQVPDLPSRAEKAISKQLLYACRYWVAHCMSAEISQDLVSMLREFASERFLLWMEVMSLSQNIKEGARTLDQAQKWSMDAVGLDDGIKEFLRDMSEFANSFQSTVPGHTPHIYLSTLTFWPDHSPISDHYGQRRTRFITERSTAMSLRSSAPSRNSEQCGFRPLYSPAGAYVVSGGSDETIHLWNALTGQSVGQPLKGHTDGISTFAYSPDGAYIVSGSWDGTIRIWDAHTHQLVGRSIKGHTDGASSVAYSPDGAYIVVCGSYYDTARIWDARTGQPVGQPLEGHTAAVNSIAYSPDGAYIVSGSDDKTIRIWDAHTGEPVGQPLEGHTHAVNSITYSPDSAYIASGSYDNTVRIWSTRLALQKDDSSSDTSERQEKVSLVATDFGR